MAFLSPGQIASSEKGGWFRIERGMVIAQICQRGLVSLGELLPAKHYDEPHIDGFQELFDSARGHLSRTLIETRCMNVLRTLWLSF